jgi:Domain of unknown function (DUF4440)
VKARLAGLLAVACLLPVFAAAQDASRPDHVWTVSWRQVVSHSGSTLRVPVFMWVDRPNQPPFTHRAPEEIVAVVRLDEQYRVARAAKDAASLKTLLNEDFSGTDASGWRFDRDMLLTVTGATAITEVETGVSTLRMAGGAVVVSGAQQITDDKGTERTLFTRVYVRNAQTGNWQLFSSTEQPPAR